MANENEARAYADFIRRKNGLPDLGAPELQHSGGYGRWATGHFHYVGATYGQEMSRGEYEPGAYSVLFPGANQMRAAVTLETLDEAGEVISSQTMPVEPKKGGVVWSKDDVRQACGPVAKVKAARTPTRVKRGATPTHSAGEANKRRRAVLMALRLRKRLRRAEQVSADRFREIARLTREDCAMRPDTPETAPDAILSDLAAAEALMRGEGYVRPTVDEAAPVPTAIQRRERTPAHERAIRRAWAERKAARAMRFNAELMRDRAAINNRAAEYERDRAEAAEAENAQLWAEIETLTAPVEALAA